MAAQLYEAIFYHLALQITQILLDSSSHILLDNVIHILLFSSTQILLDSATHILLDRSTQILLDSTGSELSISLKPMLEDHLTPSTPLVTV